jgi:hypothetical protein
MDGRQGRLITMRRVFWTVGVGLGGFLIGGKGGGLQGSVLGLMWGGSIGYGFGSIFDQKHPTKLLVVSWAATLALVGIFFGLLIGAGLQLDRSDAQITMDGAVGAAVGTLLGVLVGTIQSRRFGRTSR